MKVSRATIKQLTAFRSFGAVVILKPPSRFFIFGKGKDRQHFSMTIEGTIRESVDDYMIVEIPKPKDTSLVNVPDKRISSENIVTLSDSKTTVRIFNPENKIGRFDKLLSGTQEFASFFIPKHVLKLIKETDKDKTPTHVRFWCSSGNKVFARTFDARRYYTEAIQHERGKHKLIWLSDFSGDSFVTHAVYRTFKLLKPDDYEVSVLSNGIMIFDGVEQGITYYLRDQRLGDNWVEDMDNSIIKENALSFDPRRVGSIRHKIQHQS